MSHLVSQCSIMSHHVSFPNYLHMKFGIWDVFVPIPGTQPLNDPHHWQFISVTALIVNGHSTAVQAKRQIAMI